MTALRKDERPNAADWEELVREWWTWAGDFPIHTSVLYNRIAINLDGFQYPQLTDRGREVRFGQDLRKRRDQQFDGLTLHSAIRQNRPVWWLVPHGLPTPYREPEMVPPVSERLLARLTTHHDIPPEGSP